jgi:hypothetical protein
MHIQQEAHGERIMGSIGDQMIQGLSVHTQAIMKKVALNPSVFQCWYFVSSAIDHDTGDPFVPPTWEFGDFVSHCVSAYDKNLKVELISSTLISPNSL